MLAARQPGELLLRVRAAEQETREVPSYEIRAELVRNGFVRVENPRLPGYLSLAAPVYDGNGAPSHTLSLIGPKSDLDDKVKGRHVPELLKAVRLVSRQLGAPAKFWEG